ncbi:MAG: hypothetical protein ABI980_00345 [Nitrospirota bacterium]
MAKSIRTLFIEATILLCLTCAVDSRAASSIPEEPGEEFLVEQSYDTIVGLLFRAYSLHRDGEVDYRTARQIMGVSYDDPASAELDVAPYSYLLLVRSEAGWAVGNVDGPGWGGTSHRCGSL